MHPMEGHSDRSACRVCGGDPAGSCGSCHSPACGDCVILVKGPSGAIAVCTPCGQADPKARYRRRVVRDVLTPALLCGAGLLLLAFLLRLLSA